MGQYVRQIIGIKMEGVVPSIFNELSVEPKALDKVEARERMETFILTCIKAKSIGFSPLRYRQNLLSVRLTEDYTIGQWTTDLAVNRDLRSRWKSIATATPFLMPTETAAANHLAESVFNIEEEIAEGLGVALLKETLAISFDSDAQWDTTSIALEDIHKTQHILAKHASRPQHIDALTLTFKFHTKHGKCGKGEQKGQNTIYYCEEKEATGLLNTALIHPKRSSWLCNYDKKHKRFVVFPNTRDNEYHGFHYENEKHNDPERDLSGQNGIHLDFQTKLKQRLIN